MSHLINILGFAGSLRKDSYNRALLRASLNLSRTMQVGDIRIIEGILLLTRNLESSVTEKVQEFKAKNQKNQTRY